MIADAFWRGRGRRLVPFFAASAALLLVGTGRASAATLNVCQSGCPYTQIAPALANAKTGDTIKIGPGTYAGGLTIDTSVKLVGAGSGSTIISGGGPVLTIGEFGAATEPTVSIDGVRITGGITRSSPESTPFTGQEGVFAVGGGVEMPPNADFSGGATVTIRNSVITGNRVAPSHTAPVGPRCPHRAHCPFALAGGGGIDSWGALTLVDTTVSDNSVGSASGLSTLASDADGGAIASQLGSLKLRRSVIRGNKATATGPNGRFAEGGGIYANRDRVAILHSSVTANRAALAASLPRSVDQKAIGGGLQLGDEASAARISDANISRNSVRMTNSVGDSEAFSGGINIADPHLDFRVDHTRIARNEVTSVALSASGEDAEGDTGGASLARTIHHTRLIDNTVRVRSKAGDATAASGAALIIGHIASSAAIGNSVQASSRRGTALAAGGGFVVNERRLTMRGTRVRANIASAHGRHGAAKGGGIFDARLFSGGAPLTLIHSRILHNVATGPPRINLKGGGLYIRHNRLTRIRSAITENVPGQCSGCY